MVAMEEDNINFLVVLWILVRCHFPHFVCLYCAHYCLLANGPHTFFLGIFFAYTHEFEMTLGVLSAFLLRMYESKEIKDV